ncbi:MAG: hypothetical protein LC099_09910 [Anaerolineales bacterium]|nr:hypothetical protein [Anaerolineales bacterium]
MYLVTFVLHDPDLLEELLDAWNKIGVNGATVLFSSGMGRIQQRRALNEDMPLMPSLENFYEAPQTFSRTLFTLAKDDAMTDKILQATQSVVGDLNQPNTGILIVTPAPRVHGISSADGL